MSKISCFQYRSLAMRERHFCFPHLKGRMFIDWYMIGCTQYCILYNIYTIITPVFHDPVLVSIIGAISDGQHSMVEMSGVTLSAGVDAFRVELKLVS